MKYLKRIYEAFSTKVLYHGKKNNLEINLDKIGEESTYFYLTPDYNYALSYAKDIRENVTTYIVDTSKLLNLKAMGADAYTFQEIQKKFYQISKKYFPPDLYSRYKRNNISLWEWIRYDSDGIIKKRVKSYGYDGIIMVERHGNEYYDSYVLFNKEPIKEIKP